MITTFERLFGNIVLLRRLCEAKFVDDLSPFDALPSIDEISSARKELLGEVTAGRDGRSKWYNTNKAADRDRLFQAVYDVHSFLKAANRTAVSSDVDRAYGIQDDFYKDVSLVTVGRDLWTQRRVPKREELERTYLTFKNSKAGAGLAIGRWRDTAHTGTASTLGLLTEYTEGGILDTEVWEQSFNDVFLTGVIKSNCPVRLVSVLTPRTRKEIEIATSSAGRTACDLRDDNTEFRDGILSHPMIAWTVQEARALKLFGYHASPNARYGVVFFPLSGASHNEARNHCSVLDLHLIALQTKLLQAIDNVTGRSSLRDLIVDFITPCISDPKPYIALHKCWVGGLQVTGVPESNKSSVLIRRTDLRILQATETLIQAEQPNETLLLRTAQDVSNSVRFAADRLLSERFQASTDVAVNDIVLAHFVLDKHVAQAVWGGKLKEFELNNYQAVEKFIKDEINAEMGAPELHKLRAFASGQYENFIKAVQTGVYKAQKLTGPEFEPDEASSLFSTYLQRLGFRLARIKSENFANELGDVFALDFLNNHQYIPSAW